MGVQFDWQVGNEDGEWETVAQTQRFRWLKRLGSRSWRVWAILLAVLLVLGATTYGIIKQRYDKTRQRIAFQIQGVVDLEARAFQQGDEALYFAQQDRTLPAWFALQVLRFSTDCANVVRSQSGPNPWLWSGMTVSDICAPTRPAKVQDVQMHGDVAWVEVVEETARPVRRMRFYRQTELGWKHTAPRAEFWRDEIRLRDGNLLVRYHKGDLGYIEPFLEVVSGVSADVRSQLGYGASSRRIEIDFSIDPTDVALTYRGEDVQQDRIVFLSPWLAGISLDGKWDQPVLDDLAYRVAWGMASRSARASASSEPNALQRAIAAEYAAWYVSQDTAQAPLLGRAIDQRGVGVLPSLFLSLRGTHITTLFLVQWLSLGPAADQAVYFETLLNLEREAMLVGRKDTFMLFQDPRLAGWAAERERVFEQAQAEGPGLSLPGVSVKAVEIVGTYARVMLREPVHPSQAYVRAFASPAYFVKADESWTHTSPPPALAYER
jgi:hypothetical protein